MKSEITWRQLRKETDEVLRRLGLGEEFVVMRDGVPVGVLTPYRRRQFVAAGHIDAVFGAAPALDRERCRSDIDAIADQSPDFYP